MLSHFGKNKLLMKLIPFILTFVPLILVAYAINANRNQTERNRREALVGQTYNRATNCFQAIPAKERTTEYIQSCYDTAEKSTGVKVERYGN